MANQWCSTCHIVGTNRAGPVQEGPPSFHAIAQGGLTRAQLRVFLMHRHGGMPDLSLTREQIEDLIAYIGSLR